MKPARAILFPILLLSVALCAQSGTQAQMFHVQGTVTDPTGAVIPNARVTFDQQRSHQAFITNGSGHYEADLPLGDYTMTVQVAWAETYHRPLFRIPSATSLVFDTTLRLGRCGDMVVVPPTDQAIEDATRSCRHDDRFAAPVSDGTPFEVVFNFGVRSESGNVRTYEKEVGAVLFGQHQEAHPYNASVSVAYNLFSMRADKMVYDVSRRVLQASGNVIVQDETGERRAESIDFKLDNGRAVPIN